ncbi:MAG: VOC family protein [Actinomycetota bacterium]|nr:VOC family protein [Actinomycetota bacterium]
MATRMQVSIDCVEPARLVRFWAAALHYQVEAPPGGFTGWNAYWRSVGVPEEELHDASDAGDSIVDPAGVGPRIFFQIVPEPKIVKNRVHLDLTASGGREVPLATRTERVLAEAQRLVGEGATELRVLQQEGLDHFAVVLQDPEGNEFCIN